MLLDALPQLRDVPLSMSVLGAGPERSGLEARARRLGVDRRIRWHGQVPEAGRLFAAFDAFVLSSRTEGTPVALLEAMAAGVPVVTTRGRCPDVVSPAQAVLVASDDPIGLAAGIRAVYDDPAAARQRASAAAARLMREFGAAAWVDRYETVYGHVRLGIPVAA